MAEMPLGIKIISGYFIILGCVGILAAVVLSSYGMGGNVIAAIIVLFPAYLLLTKAKHALGLSVAAISLCILLLVGSGQRSSGLIMVIIVLYLLMSKKVRAFYETL